MLGHDTLTRLVQEKEKLNERKERISFEVALSFSYQLLFSDLNHLHEVLRWGSHCHLSPSTCPLPPVTLHLSTLHLSPSTCHPPPVNPQLSPPSCHLTGVGIPLCADTRACLLDCNGVGRCGVGGECDCNKGWGGRGCHVGVHYLPQENGVMYSSGVRNWTYFVYNVRNASLK